MHTSTEEFEKANGSLLDLGLFYVLCLLSIRLGSELTLQIIASYSFTE